MAPHDTNTEQEAKRHATPLIGMGVLVLLVVLGFFWWVSRATQGPTEVEANPAEAPASAPAVTEPVTPPVMNEPATPVPGSNNPESAPAPEQPAPAPTSPAPAPTNP